MKSVCFLRSFVFSQWSCFHLTLLENFHCQYYMNLDNVPYLQIRLFVFSFYSFSWNLASSRSINQVLPQAAPSQWGAHWRRILICPSGCILLEKWPPNWWVSLSCQSVHPQLPSVCLDSQLQIVWWFWIIFDFCVSPGINLFLSIPV